MKRVIRQTILGFVWLTILLVTGIPLVLTWSELVVSRSSMLLGTLYRPAVFASILASGISAFCSFVFIFHGSRATSTKNGKKRLVTFLVLTACYLPLITSCHVVSISSNNIPSEISEYIGPIKVRTLIAPGPESPFSVSCTGRFLKVRTESGETAWIWLGVPPWSLPSKICQDTHFDLSNWPQ